MKKILIFVLLIWSIVSQAQTRKIFAASNFDINAFSMSWLNSTDSLIKVSTIDVGILKPIRAKGVPSATASDTYILVRGNADSIIKQVYFPINSGSYAPTITNVTNVGTSSVSTCYYKREGDIVTVFGEITIDPTATGNTELRITLPISAPLGFSYQLSGQATTFDNNQTVRILADVTNDAATFRLNASVDASSHVYSFTLIYTIPGA